MCIFESRTNVELHYPFHNSILRQEHMKNRIRLPELNSREATKKWQRLTRRKKTSFFILMVTQNSRFHISNRPNWISFILSSLESERIYNHKKENNNCICMAAMKFDIGNIAFVCWFLIFQFCSSSQNFHFHILWIHH